MNEVIITPPLFTRNMETIETHWLGENINRFTCHRTGAHFKSYGRLRAHRNANFPLEYVDGKPFFMLEVSFTSEEEFIWRCTEYLEAFGGSGENTWAEEQYDEEE